MSDKLEMLNDRALCHPSFPILYCQREGAGAGLKPPPGP